MSAKPQANTIKRVIEHLNAHGLHVYGQCTDLETGTEFEGQMDFSADDAVTYIKLDDKGLINSEKRS